jgi:hypothetical protein
VITCLSELDTLERTAATTIVQFKTAAFGAVACSRMIQMRILPLGTVGSEKVVYVVLDGWPKDKSLAYVYAKHLGRGYAAYVPFPKHYFEQKV